MFKNFKKKIIAIQKHYIEKPGRVYIAPTRQGYHFAGVVFTLVSIGATTQNTDLYVFALVLLTIGFMTMLMTNSNLKGLNLDPPADFVSQEDSMKQIPLTFTNSKNPPKFALQANFMGSENKNIHFSLERPKAQAIHLLYSQSKLGVNPLAKIKVQSTFPLGIFSAWVYFEPSANAFIYPKPSPTAHLSKAAKTQQDHWEKNLEKISGNDLFSGIDEFKEHTSEKRIAWKISAKKQRKIAKQFEDEQINSHSIRFEDIEGSDRISKLRKAVYMLENFHRKGDAYSLKLPIAHIPSGSGQEHYQKCLKLVSQYCHE